MIKYLTKYRIAKHRLLWNVIFLLLSLCIVNSSFADEKEVEDFPWEVFYPAFIKKSIDEDKDGFTKKQGDCNDSDPSINPNATEICGDGVDQDCDGNDLQCPPPCANIAGEWYVTENLSVTCCEGAYCESDTVSGRDTITIQQNGCNISYDIYVPGYGTFTRTGTIDGNNIHFTGIFLILESWCTASQNVINIYETLNGDQINGTGSGIAEGTCDGSSFSCTGESTVTGTRLSSSPTYNELAGTEFDKKPSATFFKDGKIFSVIVH